MRKLAFFLLLSLPLGAVSGYSKYFTFTVNSSQITGTQTNLPLAICANLASSQCTVTVTGLAGLFTSSSCFDAIITDASDTLIPFELASCIDAANGKAVWWFSQTSVATGTVFHLWVGKSGITTNQGWPTAGSSPYDSNYKSWWHLPNGTSLTANDSTSNSNNGTATNSSATAGAADGAATINTANSSAIEKTSATGLPVTNGSQFTLSYWVKITSFVSLAQLFGFGETFPPSSNGDNRYMLTFDAGSGAHYYYWGRGADWDTGVNEDHDSVWHHLAIIYDGTNLNFVRDGVQAATRVGMPSGTVDAINTITAGGNPGGGTNAFIIDEASISSTGRSTNYLAAHYNNVFNNSAFWTVAGPFDPPAATSFSMPIIY